MSDIKKTLYFHPYTKDLKTRIKHVGASDRFLVDWESRMEGRKFSARKRYGDTAIEVYHPDGSLFWRVSDGHDFLFSDVPITHFDAGLFTI